MAIVPTKVQAELHGDPDIAGLDVDLIAATTGVRVYRVDCRKERGDSGSYEYLREFGLILPRTGGFWREAQGHESYVDATCAYFERPGVEQRLRHEEDHGDRCTAIAISGSAITALAGDGSLPDDPIPTSPTIDVEHRALAARLGEGIDAFELDERVAVLVGRLIERVRPHRLTSRRPATDAAHRRIVNRAREAIAADPAGVNLPGLAEDIGRSRFHVSRIFSLSTGTTLTRHRNRIRVALALDRLAQGEPNLARLAADLGFVDQSHMVRVVRQVTGMHPSGLRQWFRVAPSPITRR
jgi:AraC-like DNA-binding protein